MTGVLTKERRGGFVTRTQGRSPCDQVKAEAGVGGTQPLRQSCRRLEEARKIPPQNVRMERALTSTSLWTSGSRRVKEISLVLSHPVVVSS